MNKAIILASLAILTLTTSVHSADDSAAVRKDYSINVGESREATGDFVSAVTSDMSRPQSKFTITDESGAAMEFTMKPSALVFASSTGKLMTLRDLTPGDKVTVNYRSKGNINEAVALKVTR